MTIDRSLSEIKHQAYVYRHTGTGAYVDRDALLDDLDHLIERAETIKELETQLEERPLRADLDEAERDLAWSQRVVASVFSATRESTEVRAAIYDNDLRVARDTTILVAVVLPFLAYVRALHAREQGEARATEQQRAYRARERNKLIERMMTKTAEWLRGSLRAQGVSERAIRNCPTKRDLCTLMGTTAYPEPNGSTPSGAKS